MKNFLHIPQGIRLISWATAVRFAGWGFVEVFVPIFLLSFVNNYAETGLLKSIYDIVFLLALPVISRLADHVSSKKIILSGLVLYPLIALCYYFAGLYGAVALVIIARCINGLSFALDSVGKKTYMRRYAHGHIGVIFGYFDTLSNFWWLAASAFSLILIKYFPVHELFLLIIPTTLVAIFLITRIPHERKEKSTVPRSFLKEVLIDYKQMFLFIKHWTFEQKYITLLYAFMGVLYIVIIFFIPLVSFANNQSYTLIFLLTLFATLPYLFGVPLGFLADKANIVSLRGVIFVGACLLVVIPFLHSLWQILVAVFIVSVCIYYAMLILERCATIHETRSHMGSLSGAFLSISQMAQIVAPICIGFLIDAVSLVFAVSVVSILAIILIVPLFLNKVELFECDVI